MSNPGQTGVGNDFQRSTNFTRISDGIFVSGCLVNRRGNNLLGIQSAGTLAAGTLQSFNPGGLTDALWALGGGATTHDATSTPALTIKSYGENRGYLALRHGYAMIASTETAFWNTLNGSAPTNYDSTSNAFWLNGWDGSPSIVRNNPVAYNLTVNPGSITKVALYLGGFIGTAQTGDGTFFGVVHWAPQYYYFLRVCGGDADPFDPDSWEQVWMPIGGGESPGTDPVINGPSITVQEKTFGEITGVSKLVFSNTDFDVTDNADGSVDIDLDF